MENYNDDYDDLYERIDDDLEQDNVFGEDKAVEDNGPTNESVEESLEAKDKPVKVKKTVLRPQPKLNLEALQGPKGLLALNELFKDFKFRGNGYEGEDYASILRLLEEWAYRLFPKFHFEDTLKRLETLGKKREILVYLRKIRSGVIDGSDVVRNLNDDDEVIAQTTVATDAFDELLSQQIAHTQSLAPTKPPLSHEILARIERNKKLALERRLQKQKELEQSKLDISMDLEVTDVASSL